MNKYLEKWQPTTRKQLFVYPVGLRKTLSEIYYSSSTTNSSSNKISIDPHLFYQLHLCQKCHLEIRSMKQKKIVSITIQPFTSKSESILDLKLFIELVRQFRGILNPKLNCFKNTRKRKTIGTKLMQHLVKAFKNLDLHYCWYNAILIYIFLFFDHMGNGNWLYFSTQNFQL